MSASSSLKSMAIRKRVPARGYAVRGALALIVLCWVVLLVGGCSLTQYAHQADKAAYRLIAEKQRLALGTERTFRIDGTDVPATPEQPGADEPGNKIETRRRQVLLGGEAIPMIGKGAPRVLTLAECLWIAHHNSRRFQNEKEQLYSRALALANMRHEWMPLGGNLGADGNYRRGADGRPVWSGGGIADLTFTQRLATGGIATLAAGLTFATDFLDIRSTGFGSFMDANFTQPLLRGAWRGFAYEDLYRAERDLAFAVIEYDRFTQTFAVDTSTAYYRVLQRDDNQRNEVDNLARLEQTAKFIAAQVAAGMISRAKADQAEQKVLEARSRIELAKQRYEDALDNFKLTIGLPITAAVSLDKAELGRLEPLPVPFDEAEAVETALRTRPVILRRWASQRDRRRDVEIAADQFNPRLDLILGIGAVGTPPRKPFRSQLHNRSQTARLEVDYNLDQTDNRDAYRNAVIDHARAQRNLDEMLDRVQMEMRQSYRSLIKSRNTYKIQTASTELAKRRSTLVNLEFKEGLASTRDVLEAEDALRSSRIAVTSSLVNYVTTRLQFLATLGMISVDEEGKFYERDEPFYLERYRPDAPAK